MPISSLASEAGMHARRQALPLRDLLQKADKHGSFVRRETITLLHDDALAEAVDTSDPLRVKELVAALETLAAGLLSS